MKLNDRVMNIGETIKTLRKKSGLKQKELAKRCGISCSALCNIEKDYAFPSRETFEQIGKALGIPTGVLLFSAVTDDDIPQEKLQVFKALQKPLLELFEL